jgi:5-methylcytosine-specific restriction endonuclease McrA
MPRIPMSATQRLEKRRAIKKRYYERNKAAVIARATVYNQTHPDERRTTVAKHHQKLATTQPERLKANRKRGAKLFYERHAEQVKADVTRYREEHPEQVRLTQQKTNARPERVAAIIQRTQHRRALQAGSAVNDLTPAQWLTIQATFDHRCAYCGKRAKGHLSQDHVTPLTKGGAHTLSNIVPACHSCNSKKGNRAVLKPVQPLLL